MPVSGPHRPRRVAAIVGVAIAAALAGQGPAGAASADEARLVGLSNALRASVGAPALVVDESLSSVARTWAATMAAAGTISHNPSLSSQVPGWTKLAENVGMGPDLETVHRALVASRPHYANLTDPELTRIGVGVVTRGTTVFVVEDFSRPAGAVGPTATPAATAPPATGPPTTRPAPKPTTTTVPAPRAAAVTPATVAPARPVIAPPAPPDTVLPPSLALGLELTRGWHRADR